MREAARAYFQKTLQGERLLEERPHDFCRLAILFAVHDEPARRVLELLESIADQTGVSSEAMEVICLVNNDADDGSANEKRIRVANELVLALPVWRNVEAFSGRLLDEDVRTRARALRSLLRAYVIDKSRPGQELVGCNVGRARDRLLAESAHRFFRAGREGIIFMTDADAVLPESGYLREMLDLFDEEPLFIGGAGSLQLVFDPDTQNEVERRRIRERFDRYVLERRWECLENYILGRPVDMAPPDACFGTNVFFRAGAGAAIGGFQPRARYEDSYFFRGLREFAAQNGRSACSVPQMQVQAALRDSFRTAASFGHVLRNLDGQSARFVRAPFSGRRIELRDKVFHDAANRIAERPEARAFLRKLEHLPQVLYRNAFLSSPALLSSK